MDPTLKEPGNQGQKPTPPSTLTIPVTILATTLNNLAKRAVTRAEKHYMFTIVEGLGTAIGQQNRILNMGVGFNHEEWMTECGVRPEWATLAA